MSLHHLLFKKKKTLACSQGDQQKEQGGKTQQKRVCSVQPQQSLGAPHRSCRQKANQQATPPSCAYVGHSQKDTSALTNPYSRYIVCDLNCSSRLCQFQLEHSQRPRLEPVLLGGEAVAQKKSLKSVSRWQESDSEQTGK